MSFCLFLCVYLLQSSVLGGKVVCSSVYICYRALSQEERLSVPLHTSATELCHGRKGCLFLCVYLLQSSVLREKIVYSSAYICYRALSQEERLSVPLSISATELCLKRKGCLFLCSSAYICYRALSGEGRLSVPLPISATELCHRRKVCMFLCIYLL